MPMLVINLTRSKQKSSGGYKSSFLRNIHERTDNPVFTIEDAVKDLKSERDTSGALKTTFEESMDNFFLMHLPNDIVNVNEQANQYELDEDVVKGHASRIKNEKLMKDGDKYKTVQNIPKKLDYVKVEDSTKKPLNIEDNQVQPKLPNKKMKSDQTMGITDSSNVLIAMDQKKAKEDEINMKRVSVKNKFRGDIEFAKKGTRGSQMSMSEKDGDIQGYEDVLNKASSLDSGEFKRKISQRHTNISNAKEKKEEKKSGFAGGGENGDDQGKGRGKEWSSDEDQAQE